MVKVAGGGCDRRKLETLENPKTTGKIQNIKNEYRSCDIHMYTIDGLVYVFPNPTATMTMTAGGSGGRRSGLRSSEK